MFRLTLLRLAREPFRTGLVCLAIGAVIGVILTLDGFREGLYEQLRNTVYARGADLILTQAGVSNMTAARSSIPQLARGDVEAVGGVREAHPMTGLGVIYEKRGFKTPIFLLVYDSKGGPANIIEGTPITRARDIVIDRSLARKYSLAPGDPLEVSEFEFKVSGIARDTAALFTPFAFISYDDLIDFYLDSDIAADISTFPLLSYLLVELEPGAGITETAQAIENMVPTVDVFTPDALARKDADLGRTLLGPILNLLCAVAYVIGALVVGMMMFAAVQSRIRNLGLMKALGFENSTIAFAVMIEAALLTLIAFPVGVAIAHGIAGVFDWLAPLYLVLPTEPATLVRTAMACFAFAMIGAAMPVRLIARVDPAIVFRA